MENADSFLKLTPESNLLKIGNKIYFAARELNVVCSFDLISEKVSVISQIGSVSLLLKRGYHKILLWEDSIVFVPYMGKKICIFNLTDSTWREIAIRNEDTPYKFAIAEIEKDTLFALGHYYPDMVKIDLRTEKVCYQNHFEKDSQLSTYFGVQGTVVGHFLFAPLCEKKEIFCLNLENGDSDLIRLETKVTGMTGVCYNGGVFLGISRCGKFLVYWGKDLKCREIDLGEILTTDKETRFTAISHCGDGVLVGSSVGNTVCYVSDKSIKTCSFDFPVLQIDRLNELGNIILTENGQIVFIDDGMVETARKSLLASRKEKNEYLDRAKVDPVDLAYLSPIEETEAFDLKDYVNMIDRG